MSTSPKSTQRSARNTGRPSWIPDIPSSCSAEYLLNSGLTIGKLSSTKCTCRQWTSKRSERYATRESRKSSRRSIAKNLKKIKLPVDTEFLVCYTITRSGEHRLFVWEGLRGMLSNPWSSLFLTILVARFCLVVIRPLGRLGRSWWLWWGSIPFHHEFMMNRTDGSPLPKTRVCGWASCSRIRHPRRSRWETR